MGRLGRWCIRTRIPHFGEDAEYPFIFLDVSGGYCLVLLYVCEHECDSRVGEWEECVV
jgi:hypothetical protein